MNASLAASCRRLAGVPALPTAAVWLPSHIGRAAVAAADGTACGVARVAGTCVLHRDDAEGPTTPGRCGQRWRRCLFPPFRKALSHL
jgi:hypothetical protein